MTDKIVILTNCGSEEEANRIARQLVQKRLAACVNIVPRVQSLYHWKGEIESSSEWSLLIKTKRALFAQIAVELRQMHSYKVPEILAIAVVDGDEDYLRWIDEETVLAPSPPT